VKNIKIVTVVATQRFTLRHFDRAQYKLRKCKEVDPTTVVTQHVTLSVVEGRTIGFAENNN
jgi:hypothetical protein